jgi:hypothetical protein
MNKFLVRLGMVCGVATLALAGLAAPANASAAAPAYDLDIAVAGSPPAFDVGDCESNTEVLVCFQKYGDKIWVLDLDSDGHSAEGYWENYLWDGSDWVFYRNGYCDDHLTTTQWGYCNKDIYEDSTNPNAYGGKGSGIRLYACGLDNCGTENVWIRNNA